jgi:probable HAF family extracellular repeat protein
VKSIPFVALAACFLGACESPTRPVAVREDLTSLAASRPSASPSITVTALPSLGGASRANGLNDGGTIVGVSGDAAGSFYAVTWMLQSGAWTVAQLPGGLSANAAAINATGDIVGNSGSGVTQRALIWRAGVGSPIVLGCAGDLGPDVAEAINSGGDVVGYRGANDGGLQVAAVWRAGHCREELPALAVGKSAEPRGIDDAGIVSGHAYDAANTEWAVRWTFNGTSWNPPEKLKNGVWAGAWAANGPGDIAGSVCVGVFPGCPAHAFLWPYPGTLISKDLGTLGGRVSAAFALSTNEVVGWSYTSRNTSVHGFIWSATTGMRDLGPLKFDNHSEAHGVNNSRQVIGFSSGSSGQHAVVWIVP